jgi:ubiquinone/menaquinone biosynthesis C-methylase UbiE
MKNKTCPVWVGYLLASPLRKLWQNPDKILKGHVFKGMNVLDIGSAMGFYSIPLAKIVGEKGKVICIDIQEKMLEKLKIRSEKAGVAHIIKTNQCTGQSLYISKFKSTIDFALAFAVVHELANREENLSEIYDALKPGAMLLIAEPRGHVTKEDFNAATAIAEKSGFEYVSALKIASSWSSLMKKPNV